MLVDRKRALGSYDEVTAQAMPENIETTFHQLFKG